MVNYLAAAYTPSLMKVSYDWIKSWLPLEANATAAPERISAALTASGLEVEGLEEVVATPGGLVGMVVGEVLACEQHPGADRLKVTSVDVGSEEPLSIVCGAPNVAAGQKVVVATVGAFCHPSDGEPFKIKKGKIRGEVSMGMLCAEDELGLGAGHDGILVLDSSNATGSLSVGTPAAEALGLESDHVIEIGLTPNRTDGMSHFGVARDLRAALRFGDGTSDLDGDLPALQPMTGDRWATLPKGDCPIDVQVQASDGAPAYMGLLLEDVQVCASPDWLARRLRAIGLEPKNIAVDVTNYVLHDIGQPLHAFDADRIGGGKIIVRRASEGEAFLGLDEKEYKLSAADLVIADADSPLCLAGVWGGAKSGVTVETTRVFLESAWFDPVSVRKSARRHGLSTDASFRFERGVDPAITLHGLQRAAALLVELAGARISGGVSTSVSGLPQGANIRLDWDYLDVLVGVALDRQRVRNILESLDIHLTAENEEGLDLSAPAYRRDVTRPADVVEEILRIHGYDHIPAPQGMRVATQTPPKIDIEGIQREISTLLVGRGYTEIMSNSLTKSSYSELVEDPCLDPAAEVRLLNPLSSDTAIMRQSLVFQGLEVVARNRNHQHSNLRVFEFGKGYFQKEGEASETTPAVTYQEPRFLALWASGEGSDLYTLKAEVEALLARMGVDSKGETPLESTGLFSEGVALKTKRGGTVRIGQITPALAREFSISDPVFWAELPWDSLCAASGNCRVKATALPRHPWVRRDLSLNIPSGVTYAQIEKTIRSTAGKLLRSVELFDVYRAGDATSYAVALTLQDPDKTLNDKVIDKTMQRVIGALDSQLRVSLRK